MTKACNCAMNDPERRLSRRVHPNESTGLATVRYAVSSLRVVRGMIERV